MPKKSTCKSNKNQLLGEIETRIVGMQYYESVVAASEQVNLERDHDNTHDEHAIRVKNGLFEPVGYIPRQMCSWLAPLIDSGKVHVEGCVPNQDKISTDRDPSTSPLNLSIYLCKKDKEIFAPRAITTKLDALHDIVLRTYEEAQGDRIVGMDLFDSPDTLQVLWGRLSDAYFYDALRNRKRRRKTSRKAAHKFLEQVTARVKPRLPALGLGHELEVAGDDVVGNALMYAEQICHLAAFSNNQ